jgi:glutathione S-transferase
MTQPRIRLYGIPLSHPVLAVRGMIEHKGLPYRYSELPAGAHPVALWALRFRGPTVPAMRLPDGTRVQGSRALAEALERFAAQPSLYPDAPDARAVTQRAEAWGESVLQPVPRRLIRWGLRHLAQRRWFADVASPFPAPDLVGTLMTPIVSLFARRAGAGDEQVRHDLAALPDLLDEVDRLIAAGVLDSEQLNAADFQIGTSVRMLLAMQDVGGLVAGRPAQRLALRVLDAYPSVPAVLPAAWLPDPRRATAPSSRASSPTWGSADGLPIRSRGSRLRERDR